MDPALLFALGGGVMGLAVCWLIPAWQAGRPQARVGARLRAMLRAMTGRGEDEKARSRLFSGTGGTFLARAWARLLDRSTPFGGPPALRRLAILSLGLAVALAVLLQMLDALGPVGDLVALVGGTAAAVFLMAGQMGRRWQIAFLTSFADAIDLVVRAVLSGIPVSEAIRTAGTETAEPVRSEFKRISDALDIGIDLKDAMHSAAMRVRLPDFDFLVIALIIQRESGGQLAETLENLSTILRRRKELRLKVRALTAEGRMSAAIVGAMPLLTGLLMYIMSPEHMVRLLEPGLGRSMLYFAICSLSLGMLVVNYMTRARP